MTIPHLPSESAETHVEFSENLIRSGASEHKAGRDRDPVCVFYSWYQLVLSQGVSKPNTMILATADMNARPSARVVLLKQLSNEGFLFFSNHESQKGQEIAANPLAALVFYWPELKRQVRVTGRVFRISHEASLAYFSKRPRESQISAWASRQSSAIKDRQELEKQVKKIETRYAGMELPLPPHWGGYCVSPHAVEFWISQPNRLHDRIQYRRLGEDSWEIQRLAP